MKTFKEYEQKRQQLEHLISDTVGNGKIKLCHYFQAFCSWLKYTMVFAIAGAIKGAIIGAIAGATIGTFTLPLLGTFVGALNGALGGSIIGAAAGAVIGAATIGIAEGNQTIGKNKSAFFNKNTQDSLISDTKEFMKCETICV